MEGKFIRRESKRKTNLAKTARLAIQNMVTETKWQMGTSI